LLQPLVAHGQCANATREIDVSIDARHYAIAVLAAAAMVFTAQPAIAAPGDLDASFGTGGVLSTNFGGTYDWAYTSVVQPDGRVLAAGVTDAKGTYDFALARYTATQQLDPTFGDGGMVVTDFDQSDDRAYALALQPDGTIVVGGVSDAGGGKHFALARYQPDGSLDPTFGDGGRMVEHRRPLTADIIHGLAIQPDGKIVVGGVTFENAVTLNPQGDFMVARYLPDGAADPTFGIGGIATTDFANGSYDEANALALQPDERIVLGGYTNRRGHGALYGADDLALARYTPAGLPDPTFGDGGKVIFDGGSMTEAITSLALAPDATIVAAGFVHGEQRGDLLLARLQPDGALTPGWGNTHAGLTINDLGTHSERLASVVLQPDGKIVAGGQTAVSDNADFAVFRYDAHGIFDPSFGNGGMAGVDFGGREDRVHSVALQADGKIMAVGQSENDFALARFNG
jgi:uncharacterized delta-60 repeat protein